MKSRAVPAGLLCRSRFGKSRDQAQIVAEIYQEMSCQLDGDTRSQIQIGSVGVKPAVCIVEIVVFAFGT